MKRYKSSTSSYGGGVTSPSMDVVENGQYVLYSDVEPLLSEIEKLKEKNIWIEVTDDSPAIGEKVIVALQHFMTKQYRYAELYRVDDVAFRTVDDNSEVSYDWNPTHFMNVDPPNEVK